MDNTKAINLRAIIIVILACGILVAAGIYAFLRDQNGSNAAKKPQQAKKQGQGQESQNGFLSISPNTIVYGTWQGQSSFIKSYDLHTGEKHVLAELGQDIKHVSVIDDNHLLYIDQTDQDDRGYQLVLYNIKAQQGTPIYTASSSLGIDDYVLSQNHHYIAVWEYVSGDNGLLTGGQSRVYTAALDKPGKKHELYFENQENDTPVHYPRAITNTGNVYLDTFIPNSGTGWANGMSMSNFTGSDKHDLEQMKIGTYGTQPMLSPDGRYLVFGGYDPSHDPHHEGDDRIRAIVRPNIIELFDTQTNTRTRLPNLPTNYIYKGVAWDQISGNIIYNELATAQDFSNTGMYSYDISTKKATKIKIPSGDSYISMLTDGKMLLGSTDESDTNKGNLGPRYVPPFMDFTAIDKTGQDISVATGDSMMQLITIVGTNYFAEANAQTGIASVLSTDNAGKPSNLDKAGSTCSGFDNLQLCPFYFKVALAPKREHQQTEPPPKATPPPIKTPGQTDKCDDLATQQCADQGFSQGSDGFDSCYTQWQLQNRANYMLDGTCEDSPLYLYGPSGQKVTVTINTPVHNAIPSYTNGYDVTLGANDTMNISGQSYNRISYDYTNALRKFTPPARGMVVAKHDIPNTLKLYADKLGLNEKETADLITYGVNNVPSPYVFISYFDQKTSEEMLPITFTPQPDTYLNIVFYFRLLQTPPPFSVEPPDFPGQLNRTGLTAVEVSEIVE